jgi:hypothetical protein
MWDILLMNEWFSEGLSREQISARDSLLDERCQGNKVPPETGYWMKDVKGTKFRQRHATE